MWKIRFAAIVAVLVIALSFSSTVLASTTASFTVTARGDIGLPHAPTNFTVILIEDSLVRVEWTPDTSCNTSIRVKYDSLPTGPDDGYLLYYGDGTSANDTYLNLDVMWSKQYYIASSQSANGTWSVDYVYDYVENPKVTEIANELGTFNGFMETLTGVFSDWLPQIIAGIIVLAMLVFAMWKKEGWLYLLAGFATMFYGFSYITTDWRISILLVILGVGCFAKMGYDYKKRRQGV